MKHAGRWGHPHLYRDALAFRWLDTHPEDYLSLSKHLWHRNINTTIRRYGRNFDESHGLKKVGGWVGTLFTLNALRDQPPPCKGRRSYLKGGKLSQ